MELLDSPLGTSPTEFDLLAFFLVGLLGGAHCIGMCGPLVTTYAERMAKTASWDGALTLYEVRQHGLFNFGRTIGYAILGGVFGFLGAVLYGTVELAGVIRPVQGGVGIITGTLVILMGATRLVGYHQGAFETALSRSGIGSIFARSYTAISSRIDQWVDGIGIVGLGALHGLLPCMLLYPAFLYVFAQGSPIYGIVALTALGLGTIPTLFLYGTVIQSVTARQRHIVHYGLGILFVCMGYVLVAMGATRFGINLPMIDIPIYQPLETATFRSTIPL
ncbi:sulfite exporter TauE/SafE family protein [Halogranum amylolyticum]|nr:sulfite exporter TauE/SafE family protein [Halogranum amylolyticum]